MAEKMTLEDVLEQSGVMLGDGKLPTEDQLVAWREAIALHLAQPAQAEGCVRWSTDAIYEARGRFELTGDEMWLPTPPKAEE